MDNFIVSARKYRPASFDMVVGQNQITGTLKNAIKNRQIAHAYLFCGPKGVGKTTCARIFAKTINCFDLQPDGEACDKCESCVSFNTLRSFNIHELDAASNNKVEDIRSLIDQVRIPPQVGKFSIYIIDEVHMLSSAAFNAFLKTLEEPPSHAIFILATTEKHKIIPTILSRCQIFDFQRIRIEDMVERLKYVAKNESVSADENALHIIAQKADGSLRDALSIFDQMVSFTGKNITYEAVIENLNVLDYEYYFRTVDAALEGDITKILLTFNEVLLKGFDGHNFVAGLNSHFRNLLVGKYESTLCLLDTTPSIREKYLTQARKCTVDFLYKALEAGNMCDLGYKNSKNQRLHVELMLVRLCRINIPSPESPEKKKNEPEPLLNSKPSTRTNAPDTTNEKTVIKEPARPNLQPEINIQSSPARSVSVKDILGSLKSGENPENNVAPLEEEPGISGKKIKRDFSQEEFIRTWKSFCEEVKQDGPRISGMFKSVKPVIHPDKLISLYFNNTAQKDLFSQNYKQRFLARIDEVFGKGTCRLELTVDTSESNDGIIYSDEQKYNFLSSKYPAIKEFKKIFNLDFE